MYKDKEKDKACKAKWQRNWQKENREKHNEQSASWSKRNPEKVKEKGRRWRAKQPRELLMLKEASKRAKKDGLEFNIETSDIIIPDVCPILGITISTQNNCAKHNSPSLDRIDSGKGYVKNNVWVISWRANKIKSDATLEELEKIVIALQTKLKTKSSSLKE